MNPESMSRQKLIKDIRAFCEVKKISTTEFGKRAVNDSAFFGRLDRGASPTLDRVERLYEYMNDESAEAVNDILG